ncbi:MAG: hypothetical protein N3B13_10560, partial [Deltaproteobacteria bacterium]|nr:hypothetical protein [Deltaproteobacteria bacterium]
MIEKRLQEFVSCLNKRPEKIFVISDTHFNHPAMLECETERLIYQGSYESFEDFVIDNWNQRVSKDDFVIHLGDYIFSEPERFYEQYRANGRIV